MRRASTQLRRELLGRVAAAAEFGLQPRQIGRGARVGSALTAGGLRVEQRCHRRRVRLLLQPPSDLHRSPRPPSRPTQTSTARPKSRTVTPPKTSGRDVGRGGERRASGREGVGGGGLRVMALFVTTGKSWVLCWPLNTPEQKARHNPPTQKKLRPCRVGKLEKYFVQRRFPGH